MPFASTYIFRVASIDVHLAETVMRQHKIGRGKLGGLIVILKRLIVIALHVKRSRQLVATFGSHRFILGVVESVQRQMLNLRIILFEEEMVGQVIQHHRIRRIDGVRLRQHLHAHPICLRLMQIQFGNGQTDQCANAMRIQLECTLKSQSATRAKQ